MSDLRLDRQTVTELNATVTSVRRVGDSMVIRCTPDNGVLRTYKPGQYTSLGLLLDNPEGEATFLKRAYSLSDPILNDDRTALIRSSEMRFYEFYFCRVPAPEGNRPQLTPHLLELEAGDPVFVADKIIGFHTLAGSRADVDLLMIATGTGEAPHNALARQALMERRDTRIANMVLAPPGWTSAYADVHSATMSLHPNYKAIIRDYANQATLIEFMNAALEDPAMSTEIFGFPLAADSTHVFLCGDPRMIGAPKKLGGWATESRSLSLVNLLQEHGFTTETRFKEGNITFEAYW